MKKSAFNTMIRYYDTCLEGAGEFLLGRGYTADTLPLAVMEKSIRQHIFFLVNQPGFTYMGRVLQDISVRVEPDDKKCPTAQVDCISWRMQVGEKFYRDLMKAGGLTVHPTLDTLCSVLCHEAMHITEETQFREKSLPGKINFRVWNIATDLHINYQLFKYGMPRIPLKGILWPLDNGMFDIPVLVKQHDKVHNQTHLRRYIVRINVEGMSAEDIYTRLTRLYDSNKYTDEDVRANQDEWGTRKDTQIKANIRMIEKGDAIAIRDPVEPENLSKATFGQVVRIDNNDAVTWNEITFAEAKQVYMMMNYKRLNGLKNKAEQQLKKREGPDEDDTPTDLSKDDGPFKKEEE